MAAVAGQERGRCRRPPRIDGLVLLAVVCAVIAVGIYLPRVGADVIVGLAVLVSAVIWVVGQNLGELFTNGATDVNSGPLLVLIALAYWRPLNATITAVAGAEGG